MSPFLLSCRTFDFTFVLLSEQVAEIEARCKQLEAENMAMVQQNLSAQLVEAELRNQLVNCVSHDQYSQLKSSLLTAEKNLVSRLFPFCLVI